MDEMKWKMWKINANWKPNIFFLLSIYTVLPTFNYKNVLVLINILDFWIMDDLSIAQQQEACVRARSRQKNKTHQ